MKNGGGHFAPKLGGHFELESGGHFKLELGGQYHWNLQYSLFQKTRKRVFSQYRGAMVIRSYSP
jgi:hypothetical protein